MAPPTLLEQLTGVDFSDPVNAVLLGAGFAMVVGLIQGVFKAAAAVRRARPSRRPLRPDMVATIIGAGLILALSIEGMWRFFGAINMPTWGRIAFAAVFEICLLAVALRARHIRLQRQARRDALIARREHLAADTAEAKRLDAQIRAIRLRGLNDLLVWVFAAIIGILAALEAPTRPEQVARLVVPFIAATMWELALGADVEDQRVSATARGWGTKAKAAAAAVGRFFVSVAITFGWTPPTSANASMKYREKLMTRLVSVCHQIHTASGEVKESLLERQRELILDLQARGQWGTDTMDELAQRLDALYRAVELTAPAAVRPAAPAAPVVLRPEPVPAAAPEVLRLPSFPPAVPKPTTPVRRVVTKAKLDPAEIAAAYQQLYRTLGRRPSVTELGAAGASVDGGPVRWKRSSAGSWMQKHRARLSELEAEVLNEAAAELEGASA
jgi:hypothetical protein